MRLLFLASAAVLAPLAASHAADLPMRAAPASFTKPAFSWTGAYAGAALGSANFRVNFSDPDYNFDNLLVRRHRKGAGLAGLYAGYNHQVGSWVFGLEAAGNWFSGSKVTVYPYSDANYLRSELNWIGSVKARAGFAFGESLVFLAAGPAFTGIRGSFKDGTVASASSGARVGVAVATGVETAITSSLVLRLQAEYSAFRRQDWSAGGIRFGQSNNVRAVSIGLAYKFN